MKAPLGPSESSTQRLYILAGLWLFTLLVLFVFRSVVMPFAGAALIAYLVAPLVDRLTRMQLAGRHLPRWLAIVVLYALFFLGVYLAALAFLPQLYGELTRITRETLDSLEGFTPERLDALVERVESALRAALPIAEPGTGWKLDEQVRTFAARLASDLQTRLGDAVILARQVVTSVVTGVFMLFFVLMVAAFLSIDSKNIRGYLATLVPPEYAEDVRTLLGRMDRSLAGVVRGQVTICLVNGVLTLVGLWLFEVKFALLLATVATVFSLIPIFGTILSSVPIVLIGLSQSFATGVAALLWIVGIHAVEAYVLNPKIMGTAARIHPVIVAFSLIAGERLYGLKGALFAVPVAAIVVACFDFAREKAQPPSNAKPPAPLVTNTPG